MKAWSRENCYVTIIMRVEIGMRDCLRNNDIYYDGLRKLSLPFLLYKCVSCKATFSHKTRYLHASSGQLRSDANSRIFRSSRFKSEDMLIHFSSTVTHPCFNL